MPLSRAKSCEPCRSAKARCTLATPCHRCVNRRLDCRYLAEEQSRSYGVGTKKLRTLQPAPCNVVEERRSISKSTAVECTGYEVGEHGKPSNGTEIARKNTGASSSCAPTPAGLPDIQMPSEFMPELFDLPDSFDLPPISFDFDMPSTTADLPNPPEPQLEQRSRTFQQGALTAKLLFSKLAGYGRMMADAKRLPPFIYPPCWHERTARCPSDSAHRCLPEMLAVCSNLAQMFYMRRDGSEGFVWQQICTHLRQLREKVSVAVHELFMDFGRLIHC